MIYVRIRYLLILLFMVIGMLIHYQIGIGSAWYCYLASLVLYLSYYLFGTVGPAFGKLRQGQLAEAEKLINMVRRPEFLLKQHRAYYHFTKGMIALQKKELPNGELHLQSALKTGLRNDTDKALVSLNLAHIYFIQKKQEDCREYLHKAQAFKSNDLMIKEKLAELEKAFSSTFG